MATPRHPHPLWRVWARSSRLRGAVQIVVAAPTRAEAIALISEGSTVTRCVREVRS